jgi:hypothetical protein
MTADQSIPVCKQRVHSLHHVDAEPKFVSNIKSTFQRNSHYLESLRRRAHRRRKCKEARERNSWSSMWACHVGPIIRMISQWVATLARPSSMPCSMGKV